MTLDENAYSAISLSFMIHASLNLAGLIVFDKEMTWVLLHSFVQKWLG